MFGKGRYKFQMLDRRSHQIVLTKRYFLKINALNCFQWHSKFNSRDFIYRLFDRNTGEEVEPSLTYKLLKGPNV